jgi:hypothetical protein
LHWHLGAEHLDRDQCFLQIGFSIEFIGRRLPQAAHSVSAASSGHGVSRVADLSARALNRDDGPIAETQPSGSDAYGPCSNP